MVALLRTSLCGLCPWLLLVAGGWAQEAKVSSSPGDLGQIVTEIASNQAAARKQMEETLSLIEAELAARRIDANAARSLRWVLHAFLTTGLCERRPLETARDTMQVGNTAVEEAVEGLARRIDGSRSLILAAIETARKRTVQLSRTAEKAEDLDPLLIVLDRLQNSRPAGAMERTTDGENLEYGREIRLLRNVRAVLLAHSQEDAHAFRVAVEAWRSFPADEKLGWTSEDTEQRISGFLPGFEGASAAAQSSLVGALIARRPARDLFPLLAALENAEDCRLATQRAGPHRSTTSFAVNAYTALVALSRAVDDKDLSYLQKHLGLVRDDLPALGADQARSLEPLFQEWQTQVDSSSREPRMEPGTPWFTRLTLVQSPGELESIGSELQNIERQSTEPYNLDFPRNTGSEFIALAAAWLAHDPYLLPPESPDAEPNGPAAANAPEIQQIRDRVRRDVLSRSLRAPELLRPPLADQPLSTALDDLAQDFAHAREWRRLLALLEYRRSRLPSVPVDPTANTQAVAAIRSFLAGQNFELAGQWKDAVDAYQSALAPGAKIGPASEATERIAALAKNLPKTDPEAETTESVPVRKSPPEEVKP